MGDMRTQNHFKAAVSQIPYYKKRDRGGEDAFVISEELLTVADGVGGWNRKGVDPGIFARELSLRVWNNYLLRREQVKKGAEAIGLRDMLIQSVKETKAMGTCTYVMAWIDPKESLIETLNLGDSGFLIIRPPT
jgi:protein phosphatase PTC7